MSAAGREFYPVTWFHRFAEADGTLISVGVCGKTGRLAFTVMFSGDDELPAASVIEQTRWIAVDQNLGCSDGEWCLNTDCPLNRLNPKLYGLSSREEAPNLRDQLEILLYNSTVPARGPKVVRFGKPPFNLQATGNKQSQTT